MSDNISVELCLAESEHNYLAEYVAKIKARKNCKSILAQLKNAVERYYLNAAQMNVLAKHLLANDITDCSRFDELALYVCRFKKHRPLADLLIRIYGRKQLLLESFNKATYLKVIAGLLRLYREGFYGNAGSLKAEAIFLNEIDVLHDDLASYPVLPTAKIEALMMRI